jgi:hypothetical protein
MKPIKINQNSWHYHVATTYTDGNVRWATSICEYNRKVFMGLVSICLIILASSIALLALLAPIFYIILYLIYGLQIDPGSDENAWILFGLVCYLGILVIYLIHLFTEWKQEKLDEECRTGIERKDSYIKSAWKSFKDKVCVKVEWE